MEIVVHLCFLDGYCFVALKLYLQQIEKLQKLPCSLNSHSCAKVFCKCCMKQFVSTVQPLTFLLFNFPHRAEDVFPL